MKGKKGSTVTKGGKPVDLGKKHYGYYQEIADKLKPYAETEYGDEPTLYFRSENLPEVFRTIKVDFKDHHGKMAQLGFFKIKTTDPPGWYFYPEGDLQVKDDRQYTTRQLRAIARKLYKSADRDNSLEDEQRFRFKGLLEMTLNRWGHNPDRVIPLLEEKNYLVKRLKQGDPESFFIFRTQKEGQAF